MENHQIIADLGNCREVGVNTMYPPEGDTTLEAIAKSVCESCVVVDMCRAEGIKRHESGVWGGLTERERYNLKHKVRREKRRGKAREA